MNGKLSRAALNLHERFTGRHILRRLDELNSTQWLSRDELLALQRDKLLHLVEYADQYVPYYRRVFKEVGFRPEDLRMDLDNLEKIPILTKAIIRNNWDDMLTTEPKRRKLLSELCTSGSTGEPLVFMQDRDFRDAVTADVQRHMGWGGWKLGDAQAVIWGSNLHPGMRQRMRSGLIDWVWNRFQANAFAITEENWAAFTEQVLQRKPRILFGYASGVHRFAQFVRCRPHLEITFNGIFTSAEKLVLPVREFIEETFGCKVFNRYGTFELGGLACECEAHKGLHISVENNYVEILRDRYCASSDETGDLIVTNLVNHGMPFIRYSIGDVGAWDTGENCSCGRAAPSLKTLDGRIKDAFLTRDGRTIYTGFSGYAFKCLAHPEILQFQVVQKTLDLFIVRLVYAGDPPKRILDDITKAFRGTFGENVNVEFEFMEKIPELPSGKHQYVLSELNQS